MNPDQQYQAKFNQAVEWLQCSNKIVVFSGAGMSASSGINTFRDEDGFWQRFPPDQFANWKGLLQTALLEPLRLADFLIAILEPVAQAAPNSAHLAVAELANHKEVSVITQNIDQLHQSAGSQQVFEIHGSLFEIICYPEGQVNNVLTRDDLKKIVVDLKLAKQQFWKGPKLLSAIQPLIGASLNGFHRPRIVLFGDQLAEPDWTNAQLAASECDLFLSIGTSQSVYPAAGLPELAKENGSQVIVIDPQTCGGDLWLAKRAEEVLPQLLESAFG